jgi:DNA-binding CsgD family transcriptional regulator
MIHNLIGGLADRRQGVPGTDPHGRPRARPPTKGRASPPVGELSMVAVEKQSAGGVDTATDEDAGASSVTNGGREQQATTSVGTGRPTRRRRGFHRKAKSKAARPARVIDLSRIVKVVGQLPMQGADPVARRRQLLVELCKVIGAHLSGSGGLGEELRLPNRLRQTLQGLIRGDSEKQIAIALDLSPHTVHVYVKQLYKRFNASSRGELLARFIRGGS